MPSWPDEPSFDVVVIGAGTAGLAAARAAHGEGARVAVIDHGPLGTFCARLGCMPSKALIEATNRLARTRHAPALGIALDRAPALSWSAARARKEALVAGFVEDVVRETTSSKSFSFLRGAARFLDASTLTVNGRPVLAKQWVVATGSSPVRPDIPGLAVAGELAMTSDEVFGLASIPASVGVVGAGAVGIELGQVLARAGSTVHVLGHDDRIAGLGPGPLRDALTETLAREITLHVPAKIEHVRREGQGVALALSGGGVIPVARLLVAAGRRPNLEGLGLSRAGVRVEDGKPVHDEHLRTTNPSIFVAGDAAGGPAILHVATLQGRTAGLNAAHPDRPVRVPPAPPLRVVFCDPAVATVGLDPEAAAREGRRVCVVTRPFAEQGRARLMDATAGVAQLVVDRATRKLLGFQLVGANADLLVHLASYAMHFGATVDDLLALQHYHPTLAEMLPSLAQKAVTALDGAECTRGDIAAARGMQ
ncbi:MAG TPA: FAD-dependent oxidoreductase [Polyangiaceae bacterium]|nr:FAD-dependent oxidoreductase [Polyangiaceae bacterium]